MAFDVTTPESPGWWLARLVGKLQAERPEIDRLEALFRGDHPLPNANSSASEAFKAFQRLSRSNYLALVVEAPLERMTVTGFRAGPEDRQGDETSWKLWQQARLDADQVLVHRTMLSCRRAYVIVGPHPRRPGEVLITPEHPSQVIVEHYPDDHREVRAGLKLFVDDVENRAKAYVYLPDYVYVFRSPEPITADEVNGLTPEGLSEWEHVTTEGNPTAPVVPVVEFANRPTLRGTALCEFEDVIDIQNRINQTLLHRLVAEKFGAFRQTAVLNLAFDEDEDGNAIAPELPADPGVAWLLQGENLSMWQSQQTSTKDILEGVSADIRDLAAITRTPPHYLLNSIVNASGDALKSAETGLVAKVREHISQAGESWEMVIHLAHLILGTGTPVDELESVWADPESRSISELHDAANKSVTSGVPWQQRMEMLGYTPQQIRRMESDRMNDALIRSMGAPPASPAQQAAQEAGSPG